MTICYWVLTLIISTRVFSPFPMTTPQQGTPKSKRKIKNLFIFSVRISSYGCSWEVWRALKKPELLSAAPRATLTHLSCSSNFPRAPITRYTHAKYEQIDQTKVNSKTSKVIASRCYAQGLGINKSLNRQGSVNQKENSSKSSA